MAPPTILLEPELDSCWEVSNIYPPCQGIFPGRKQSFYKKSGANIAPATGAEFYNEKTVMQSEMDAARLPNPAPGDKAISAPSSPGPSQIFSETDFAWVNSSK